jgi:hypothetical protein
MNQMTIEQLKYQVVQGSVSVSNATTVAPDLLPYCCAATSQVHVYAGHAAQHEAVVVGCMFSIP